MKIQSLHFKNINSLYGEWKIDFTHQEYKENGIFALTGPTGSGKSSILDAICLALYGYTPRLGNITKSSNEIMSRHTGECFAEITFLAHGEEYTCRWEQRRAKKSPTGTLQNPTYEMSKTHDGAILASSRAEVLKLVEEKTGMNYERFTRTMLLSQGKFDAFLQAKVEEKSSILEEITGKEIYTKISAYVHEKLRIKKEELTLIQAQNAHLNLLETEEVSKIQEEIKVLTLQLTSLQKEKKTLQTQKDWILTLQSLVAEISQIILNKEVQNKKLLAFTPQKERLANAKKASELDFLYAEFCSLRKEQKQDLLQLNSQEKLEPEAHNTLTKTIKFIADLEKNLKELKTQMQKNATLFQEVRIMDHGIQQEKEALQKKQKLLTEEKQKYTQLLETQKLLSKKQASLVKKIESVEKWQKEHQIDACLISKYSMFCEQLKQLSQLLNEGIQERQPEQANKKRLLFLEKESHNLQKKIEQEEKDLTQIKEEKIQINKEMTVLLDNKTLREFQSERDHLLREKSLVTRIISLEKERKLLTDNVPCPLCGSTNHPYTIGNIPQISPLEVQIKTLDIRILAIAETEKKAQVLDTKEHTLIITNLNSKNSFEKNAEAQKSLREEHARQVENIQKRLDQYYTKNTELVHTLLPFKFEPIKAESQLSQDEIETIQKKLQTRLQLWQEKETQKQSYDKEMHSIITELATSNALIKSHLEKQKTQEESFEREEKTLLITQADRLKLFGEKNPDREEKLLQTKRTHQENTLNQHQELREIHIKNLHAIQTRCKTLREQCDRRHILLTEKENAFLHALIEKGFYSPMENINEDIISIKKETYTEDMHEQNLSSKIHRAEKNYLAVCLSKHDLLEIENELLELEESSKAIEITLKDRQEKLKTELEKKLFPLDAKQKDSNISLNNSEENLFTSLIKSDFAETDATEQRKQECIYLLTKLTEKIHHKTIEEKELTEKNIVLSQTLIRNEEAKNNLKNAQERIKLHQNDVSRYEKLHSLIGSVDGKKYRNFAQGLTFEMLIGHANKQLANMSDRYLLQHDQSAPLKLNVIDHYQGGEIRTTNNLSGGESFIVSLALALGLSQMVSQKVRVDSLFLDEGFGTLDDDALETALETLTQLTNLAQKQAHGHDGENTKLIGIISHISSLKDRIPVQIQLIPQLGGKSTLQGAGCQKLA